MLVYLAGIFSTIILLMLISAKAFVIWRVKATIIVICFALLYFLFFDNQTTRTVQRYFSNPIFVSLSFLLLLCGLYFWLFGHVPELVLIKIAGVILVPLLAISFAPTKGSFHVLDAVVFVLLFGVLSFRVLPLPLINESSVIVFDGLWLILVLWALFMYIGYRKLDIGFTTPLSVLAVFETIIYTAVLIAFNAFIGIKLDFLHFKGWHPDILRMVVLSLYFFFHAAMIEEFFFRGLIFGYLRQFVSRFTVIVPLLLSTGIFGLTHLDNGGWPMVLLACIAGLFYGITYQRTRSLLCAAFIHTVTNVVWMTFF